MADQAGPAYNVGATDKLTVPGFANTPKFNGFYGALPQGASGGFAGVKPVPTAQDIAAAKASTTAILQAALAGTASFDIPSQFKNINGVTNIQITRLTL